MNERFWSKVRIADPGACWEWAAHRNAAGYGTFRASHPRRMMLAHRVAYAMANGKVPDGMFVCHACDNPGCVNPLHLFVGTAADNNADRNRKGRQSRGRDHGRRSMAARKNTARGERTGQAKLTERDVREIRASSEPSRSAGRRYGVSHRTILLIRRGETWRHLA